jgi:ADP-ribose pyrophosphatase
MSEAPFADTPENFEVVQRDLLEKGHLLTFVRETFDYNGEAIVREFVEHPGAVGIIALDDDDRVLTIRQYRHPIRTRAWEAPAGLLDSPDEPLLAAAQRELAEETDMVASEWKVLADIAPSSGSNNEVIRIFLARGLSAVTTDFVRDGEEADIEVRWVAIDEVAHAASGGAVRNAILVTGVFAALAARSRGWSGLRDGSA